MPLYYSLGGENTQPARSPQAGLNVVPESFTSVPQGGTLPGLLTHISAAQSAGLATALGATEL